MDGCRQPLDCDPIPSSRSWKRSREARLWRSLDPADSGRVVRMAYGENAGAEVLLRAFLEERDCNPVAVRFWLAVYERLAPPAPDGPEGSGARLD